MRAKQQGTGKHNQIVTQGKIASGFNSSHGERVSGEIIGFVGRGHESVIIRASSGYRYIVDTRTVTEK